MGTVLLGPGGSVARGVASVGTDGNKGLSRNRDERESGAAVSLWLGCGRKRQRGGRGRLKHPIVYLSSSVLSRRSRLRVPARGVRQFPDGSDSRRPPGGGRNRGEIVSGVKRRPRRGGCLDRRGVRTCGRRRPTGRACASRRPHSEAAGCRWRCGAQARRESAGWRARRPGRAGCGRRSRGEAGGRGDPSQPQRTSRLPRPYGSRLARLFSI